jgi:hypothetical protein
MAYVPGCRYDFFISYATEDNRDGWVDQFRKTLGEELGSLLDRQFDPKSFIFFDKREVKTKHSFPNELIAAAQESAILIPILSKYYLSSSRCIRERTEFFSKNPCGAEPATRLAPVLVLPIDPRGMDKLYCNAQPFSFLRTNGQEPLIPGSIEWNMRLLEFAQQLKNALQWLRRNGKPIFLGKAAAIEGSQNFRALFCTELERRYFRIVPEAPSALDEPDEVGANLQKAALAIHFLGASDAATRESIEASIAVRLPTILYQRFGSSLTPAERSWLDDFERKLEPSARNHYHLIRNGKDHDLLTLVLDLQNMSTVAGIKAGGRLHAASSIQDDPYRRRLQLFLCHSSEDKPFVREIYIRLGRDGFGLWFDEENLLPGQDWEAAIRTNVKASDVVLVFISRTSVGEAGYFHKEISFALDAAQEQPEGAIFIVPVRIEDAEVPNRLRKWQWVDLFHEEGSKLREKGYEQLMRALKKRAKELGIAIVPARPR